MEIRRMPLKDFYELLKVDLDMQSAYENKDEFLLSVLRDNFIKAFHYVESPEEIQERIKFSQSLEEQGTRNNMKSSKHALQNANEVVSYGFVGVILILLKLFVLPLLIILTLVMSIYIAIPIIFILIIIIYLGSIVGPTKKL